MEKSEAVIDLLKQMKNKNLYKFATFDIKEFNRLLKNIY